MIGVVECGICERLEYGQRERPLYHASINEEGLIERLYVQSQFYPIILQALYIQRRSVLGQTPYTRSGLRSNSMSWYSQNLP